MLLLLALACPARDKPSPGTDDTGSSTDTTPTDSPGDSLGSITTPTPEQVDDDGDGYSEEEGDCDDLRASISPGVAEDCETWADDDCQGGNGNNGCEGHGWLATYGQFNWDPDAPEPSGFQGNKIVGVYGTLVCDAGGTLVAATDPTPPCPDCLWTFHSVVAYKDPWVSGPCGDLIDGLSPGGSPVWLDSAWGFSYLEPATGEDGPGWLVQYHYYLSEWTTWAGPGDHAHTYTFSTDGVVASFYWYGVDYDAYYTYWRYGEPTRAYNP